MKDMKSMKGKKNNAPTPSFSSFMLFMVNFPAWFPSSGAGAREPATGNW